MSLGCQNPNDFPFVPTSPKSILACKRVGVDPTDLLLQNKTLNNQVMEQYYAITEKGATFSEKMKDPLNIIDEQHNNSEDSQEKVQVDYIISKEARILLSSKRDQRALRKYQEIEHKRRQLCQLRETLSSRQVNLYRPTEQQQLNVTGASQLPDVSGSVQNFVKLSIPSYVQQNPIYESPLEIEIRNLQNTGNERQTDLQISTLNSELMLTRELLRHSNIARNKQLEFIHSQHQLRNYLASKHQTENIILARCAERNDLILLNSQINSEKRSQAQLQRRLLEQQRLNRALLIQERDAAASIRKLQWQERKVASAITGCKVEGMKYMWREINNIEKRNNIQQQLKGLKIEPHPYQPSCYLTQNHDFLDTHQSHKLRK